MPKATKAEIAVDRASFGLDAMVKHAATILAAKSAPDGHR